MSMIMKVQQWARQLAREAAPIDPVVFDDPIAMMTLWTPLARGGASFATHRLDESDPDRLALKKSLGSFLFGGLFVVAGLGLLGTGAVQGQWVQLLLGLLFTAGGAAVAWPSSLVFDGAARQFLGRKGAVPFRTVHAVQLLKEHVRGNKTSYWSYELNLVLKDGARVQVVDHGDLPRIRRDSARIRALIGCKLWDATSVGTEPRQEQRGGR